MKRITFVSQEINLVLQNAPVVLFAILPFSVTGVIISVTRRFRKCGRWEREGISP